MTFRQHQGLIRIAGEGTATVAPDVDFREAETPSFRSKVASPIEIVLPSFVRSVMLDECWTLTRDDGMEAGGFLFARIPRPRDTSIRLFHATGTGNGIRRSGSLKLDSAEWIRAEEWIARNEFHDTDLIGFWHTHPGSDDGMPSNADLRGFLTALDWNLERGRRAAFSVGLILTADREGMWGSPRIRGWVTKREGYSGRPVTEPAEVRRFG